MQKWQQWASEAPHEDLSGAIAFVECDEQGNIEKMSYNLSSLEGNNLPLKALCEGLCRLSLKKKYVFLQKMSMREVESFLREINSQSVIGADWESLYATMHESFLNAYLNRLELALETPLTPQLQWEFWDELFKKWRESPFFHEALPQLKSFRWDDEEKLFLIWKVQGSDDTRPMQWLNQQFQRLFPGKVSFLS